MLRAGRLDGPGSAEALEKLCRAYWYPLYAFARRQACNPEEAQDATQEFFSRLLAKDYLQMADPNRGRFRSFLLAAMKNTLANERRAASRHISPDGVFIRWSGFGGLLEEAPTVLGPWAPTPGQFDQTQGEVLTPHDPATRAKFFRVRGL